MNGRILRETPFEDFFAQPAAADDGCALGAALAVAVGRHGVERPRRVRLPQGRTRRRRSWRRP